MSPTPYLLFRAFCETCSMGDAQAVAEVLRGRLSRLGTATIERVEPYWKISGTYELCVCVDVSENEDLTMESLKELFDVVWTVQGGLMIWQSGEKCDFESLPLRWASFEYVIPPLQ